MTDFRLSDAARAAGHRLVQHERLGSTNAEALKLARSGEGGPLWIVTHRQTEGRGRRGAAWSAPEGNLSATLLFPLADIAPERVPTLGFVAGLALAQALEDVSSGHTSSSHTRPHPEVPERSGGLEGGLQDPQRPREASFEAADAAPQDEGAGGSSDRSAARSPFQLKWPNDVLVGDAKLAGLLLEAEGRRAVAIGFGVNVASAPGGLPYPATALARLGVNTDAAGLLTALSARFVAAARLWDDGRGFSAIRRAWLARAAGIGSAVSVRVMDRTVAGIFEEIDEGGRLVILAPDGTRRTVTAGEVHFGQAATAA